MMRKSVTTLTLISLLCATPAMAAEDLRIASHGPMAARSTSTGFGAALRIGIGADRRKDASRVGLHIGPSVSSGGRQAISDFGRLNFAKDGAVDLRIAGQSVSDRVGAQEGQADRKGPSTGGWIAIALGAVVVVGGIAVLAVASSVQDE